MGYQNVIDDVQKKLNMISRDIVINKGRHNSNQLSNGQPNIEKKEIRK